MPEQENIRALPALIYKVQTTVDGGLRLTLDFPSSEAAAIADLMKRQAKGKSQIRVVFLEPEDAGGIQMPELSPPPIFQP